MMGRTSKDIKEAVLAGSNFVVADMLEAAEALSEAAKTDGYKAAAESLTCLQLGRKSRCFSSSRC